jgi:Protein of unknown function (DUF3098)
MDENSLKKSEEPVANVKRYSSIYADVNTNKSAVETKSHPVIEKQMLFDKTNFLFMWGGLALVIFGFVLMSGGQMPDANTFDESIIYSFTRITLAPLTVLSGLGVFVYAIFKN